jgi:hypothetical protein
MVRLTNATQNTRIYQPFEYFYEDTDCRLCRYWRGKKGCSRAVCCCEDIKWDCMADGRIKRKKERKKKWRETE